MMAAAEARQVLDAVREGRPMPEVKVDEALTLLGDLKIDRAPANEATIETIVDTAPREPWVTSTGIVVGCLAPKKRPAMSRDDERLQAALLEPLTERPLRGLQAVAGAIWKWL